MAEVLNIELMVEVQNGEEPVFTATVPRFRLFAGDQGHRVIGQGATATEALRRFYEQLFDVVAPTVPTTETVKAPPLERVEEMDTFGTQTSPSQDAPDA